MISYDDPISVHFTSSHPSIPVVKGLIKMAKKLEIDYADAVVGFSFHSRRCAPVLEGIVVAKEYAPTLLTVSD
jgi:hypothetical protein